MGIDGDARTAGGLDRSSRVGGSAGARAFAAGFGSPGRVRHQGGSNASALMASTSTSGSAGSRVGGDVGHDDQGRALRAPTGAFLLARPAARIGSARPTRRRTPVIPNPRAVPA